MIVYWKRNLFDDNIFWRIIAMVELRVRIMEQLQCTVNIFSQVEKDVSLAEYPNSSDCPGNRPTANFAVIRAEFAGTFLIDSSSFPDHTTTSLLLHRR